MRLTAEQEQEEEEAEESELMSWRAALTGRINNAATRLTCALLDWIANSIRPGPSWSTSASTSARRVAGASCAPEVAKGAVRPMRGIDFEVDFVKNCASAPRSALKTVTASARSAHLANSFAFISLPYCATPAAPTTARPQIANLTFEATPASFWRRVSAKKVALVILLLADSSPLICGHRAPRGGRTSAAGSCTPVTSAKGQRRQASLNGAGCKSSFEAQTRRTEASRARRLRSCAPPAAF